MTRLLGKDPTEHWWQSIGFEKKRECKLLLSILHPITQKYQSFVHLFSLFSVSLTSVLHNV